MDSNQKPLPSLPPPPPPPPPKNGNTRACPPLISTQLHDEGDGGAIGAGDMEEDVLCRGSPRASGHNLSGSSRSLEGKASSYGEKRIPPRNLVGGPGRDEATAEQSGLLPRRSREVARLGTVAVVDDRPYVCADCSMTFARETTLSAHMRSHNRDHLSSESEQEAPRRKRRRNKKSRMRTVKPLEATWGNTDRRNGCPKDAPRQGSALEVNISKSGSHNIEVRENDRSGDDNSVIVINNDDDDTNPVIVVAGSCGAPSPAPDAAVALAMALAPAVAVATPTPAPHAAAASVNIEGAPAAAASTAAVTIPPAPASAAAARIIRAPLATAVNNLATQSAPDMVKGNNGSAQAGAHYRYGGNGNVDSGTAVAGSSSGSHTYNTSTVAGGESKEGRGKKTIYSPQSLGGHMIMETKGRGKLDLQSGPHKCKVCNHVCQTVQELSFHTKSVHPLPGVVVSAASAKEKTFKATGINNFGAAVDGPSNTMGCRFPAGASRGAILALPAPMAPVHQPPQGTMAMADNPVTGHFSAANTSTGWPLPVTTSSILPSIPLHNQMQNLPEQIAAVAPSNHGHRSINPAFLESNAIASSSSTPRPGTELLNNFAANAPANTMGHRLSFFLAGRRDTQALHVSRPVHHPTQGMAMDGNYLLTGHFPAANTSTGGSLPATTSSILPPIPLHNQMQNLQEQIAAVAPGNHGHRSINRAFLESNAIASSSSTPRPGTELLNNFAANAPANTMGRCLSFFLAGRSDTQVLPVSRAVHHPTQGVAMDGNYLLTGHFPAAISATFPATTTNSNATNSNVAGIDALANTMYRLPFSATGWLFPATANTGRSAIHAPPVSMPVHQPTQGMAAMAGNPVTGHFPAAMAGNGRSFPATTSSVLPAIPLQTQEQNPPQGRVVPANGEHPSTHLFGSNTFPTFPSQNQAENPSEEAVPGNNGGRTILLFGNKIAEGQKDIKEPKK